MAQESNNAGFLSLPTVLTLTFLTLKLAQVGEVATWSWWWVFSPILISLGIGIILVVIAAIVVVKTAKKKKENQWESKLGALIKRIKEEED